MPYAPFPLCEFLRPQVWNIDMMAGALNTFCAVKISTTLQGVAEQGTRKSLICCGHPRAEMPHPCWTVSDFWTAAGERTEFLFNSFVVWGLWIQLNIILMHLSRSYLSQTENKTVHLRGNNTCRVTEAKQPRGALGKLAKFSKIGVQEGSSWASSMLDDQKPCLSC